MVTFLFTSILLLGFLAVVLYFWQRPTSGSGTRALDPPASRGLFADNAHQDALYLPSSDGTMSPASAEKGLDRVSLIERAGNGDISALDEAHQTNDEALYNSILDSLIQRADSDARLLGLLSHVMRSELPVSKGLAEVVIEQWKRAPDRSSTAKALHIAALSDDAGTYRGAVEAALQLWRDRKLTAVSADELLALFDGEFWVLSSGTRTSGTGFRLKQTLARARQELQSAARVN